MRIDGRKFNELREVKITRDVTRYAEGSALIEAGHTKVLCTATVDTVIPKWLQGAGKGWVSAEYGMLPRSTHTRIQRDKAASGGRTQEISRLIARSLRAAVNLKALGERQIIVDCDVLQADGGTRTAAITGGFVALALALEKLKLAGFISQMPLTHYVAAISVGLDGSQPMLDLCYDEDAKIHTDMNFVMTSEQKFVEIQGTAEGAPFSQEELAAMIEMAKSGCQKLFQIQATLMGHLLDSP